MPLPGRLMKPDAPPHRSRWTFVLLAGMLACMAGVAIAGAAAAPDDAQPARAVEASAHAPQVGIASVYARSLDGQETASGEPYETDALTAAHRTLPLGTEVRVTNLANHRSVVVRINDRGPAIKGRIIDLSTRAAHAIGLRADRKGLARVRVTVLREPEREDRESGGA